MSWIILQGPKGIRKVAEGAPYRLEAGEFVAGSEMSVEVDKNASDLAALANEHGIAWGDMLAAATKALGIKPCKSCEQRRLIMNRVSEIGVAKAFELIRNTFSTEVIKQGEGKFIVRRKGESHGIE